MSGGQLAALVFAIILLLPGGCFLLFGIGFATDPSGVAGLGWMMLLIAAALLAAAVGLFRFALRKRAPPPGETPQERAPEP